MIWRRRQKQLLARELTYLRDDVERLRRDLWLATYGRSNTFIPYTSNAHRPWSSRAGRRA